MSLSFKAFPEAFPLLREFRIARGAKTQADVITLIVTDGEFYGWGESVPYNRYGETTQSVLAQLEDIRVAFTKVKDVEDLYALLPAGAARNALDSALWDLKAKISGKSVATLLDIPLASRACTAQTISIDTPEGMQQQALAMNNPSLLKIKLDDCQILERIEAVHKVSPQSRLILDANEGWEYSQLSALLPELHKLGVVLIEQPLSADHDIQLESLASPVMLCADESCHVSDNIPALAKAYQAVNIKLDKTGGLTEAVRTIKAAKQHNLEVMLGCMVGSSLAMAPAYYLSEHASFIDLDGPLFVAKDRADGFVFNHGKMKFPEPFLWGLPGQYGQGALADRWHKDVEECVNY